MRVDGSSKVVGPLSSSPYAVLKIQHPMVRTGHWAKTQRDLGSYSGLRDVVSVV